MVAGEAGNGGGSGSLNGGTWRQGISAISGGTGGSDRGCRDGAGAGGFGWLAMVVECGCEISGSGSSSSSSGGRDVSRFFMDLVKYFFVY